MDQRGGLQRVRLAFVLHVPASHAAQFRIDPLGQAIERSLIAAAPGPQEIRDFARGFLAVSFCSIRWTSACRPVSRQRRTRIHELLPHARPKRASARTRTTRHITPLSPGRSGGPRLRGVVGPRKPGFVREYGIRGVWAAHVQGRADSLFQLHSPGLVRVVWRRRPLGVAASQR